MGRLGFLLSFIVAAGCSSDRAHNAQAAETPRPDASTSRAQTQDAAVQRPVRTVATSDAGRRGATAQTSHDAGMDSASEPMSPNPMNGQPDAARSGDDAGILEDPTFSTSEPLEVSVDLSSSDWDVLRQQGRSLPSTVSGCTDPGFTGYTDFQAELRLLGRTLSDVGARKKGYIGSISVLRPSLSIDFGQANGADRVVAGYKRLTLNNNREDTTNAHQCLAYALFERAGLPAPRCGLARVTVNGVGKGYFTNVEPIKKPFLRRVFGEADGNLYELEAPTDLTAEQAGRIELKTNTKTPDRADLDRLIAALALPDDQLVPALEAVLDLDQYLTFWAAEALLGQWDGLSGHGTNGFLYHARRDNRFHPIAWGADQAFTSIRSLLGDGTISVFASTRLTKRLWALPEWRAKYQARMRMLLDTVWRPDDLLARLHEITKLTNAPPSAVAATERFIQMQRQLLEEELALREPPTPRAIAIPNACDAPVPVSSDINFNWNATPRDVTSPFDQLALLLTSVQAVPNGSLAMDIHVRDRAITLNRGTLLGATGVNTEGNAFIGLTGTDAMTGNTIAIGIMLPIANYHVGEIAFHGYETFGVVAELINGSQHVLGFIGQGSLKLDMAGSRTGDPVRGSWSGMLAAQPMTP